jgi:hypothetical protein
LDHYAVDDRGIGTLVVPNPEGDGYLKITSVPNGEGGVIQHIETFGAQGGQATQLQIVGPGINHIWIRDPGGGYQLAPPESGDQLDIGNSSSLVAADRKLSHGW